MSLNSEVLSKCHSLPPSERHHRRKISDVTGMDDFRQTASTFRKLSLRETEIGQDMFSKLMLAHMDEIKDIRKDIDENVYYNCDTIMDNFPQTATTFRKLGLRGTQIGQDMFSKLMLLDMDEIKDSRKDIDVKVFLTELPFYNCDTIDDDFFGIQRRKKILQNDSFSAARKDFASTVAFQLDVVRAEGYHANIIDPDTLNAIGIELEAFNDGDDADIIMSAYQMTCYVCFDSVTNNQILNCPNCETYICFQCMTNHVEAKILDGATRVICPGESCRRLLSYKIVSAFAPPACLPIYIKNTVELENNPDKKTCPNCHKIELVIDKNKEMKKIKCATCHTIWCFHCHAPWHSHVTCKQFQKDVKGSGGKALKYWAKSKGKDTSNARKCPHCHFYIERISGCDHMTCNKCYTDFCFKCGCKHRSLGWFGNHYSTYSFLGCKYNLHPKKKVLRISVRTSALVGVIVAAPVVASLAVSAASVCLALSPVLLPICIYRKIK